MAPKKQNTLMIAAVLAAFLLGLVVALHGHRVQALLEKTLTYSCKLCDARRIKHGAAPEFSGSCTNDVCMPGSAEAYQAPGGNADG